CARRPAYYSNYGYVMDYW
nr:immunoglobulin heavy chain junction region [Mus musculus]MBK4187168.1 immunoglobulin heavy chain junction region [Mus musculus]MBK4187169.1 immunoglobulin heavy chain junction region [Mus musculus]MBK4187170.1 immunoglobulin heavy chain junction region [Mus musculus]MBK4187171.1 immunoglobulin heavy chain junction region [Mus musculus]